MRLLTLAGYAMILAVLAVIALAGQPRLASQQASAVPRFDPDRALAHLSALDELTRKGGGRAPGTRGHRDAISYIAEGFRREGLSCRLDRFADSLGGDLTNVLAELPGREDEVIILGAHHDAEGRGPAVVDGLTGVAVLLESARALRESRLAALPASSPVADPRSNAPDGRSRTILFVSWDGESYGCAGASHFLERYSAEAARRVRAVISLDSVGWKDGFPVVHSPHYFDRFAQGHSAPDWLVWKVIRSARRAGISAPLGDRLLSVPYQVASRFLDTGYYSDDRPFLLAGIPGVFVSDASLSRFYPYYGSAQDTLQQVGRRSLEFAGRLVTAAIRDLADSETLPAGEADYLLLPSPVGWMRLTADQLRMLAPLLLLPGLLGFIGAGRRSGDRALLILFALLSAVFLAGSLAIDPIVFGVLAAPPLLAAPLLTLHRKGAVYGFLASLIPLLVVAFLLVPVFTGGYARQFTFPRTGWACLGVLAALAVVLAGASAAAFRKRARGGENRSSARNTL